MVCGRTPVSMNVTQNQILKCEDQMSGWVSQHRYTMESGFRTLCICKFIISLNSKITCFVFL